MRGKVAYAGFSLLALVPCFWQSRIQAGDLSSHIYNAWLAQRIAAGAPLGLTLVSQSTNVLLDVMLEKLLAAFGADAAQHIAVAAAVLVFVWGAFAVARRIAGRNPWELLPAIAMLAYGWDFHMGLFNFYLALGMSLWAVALAWDRKLRGIVMAAVLLAIAYTAHGLPVAWAAAVIAYIRIANALPAHRRTAPAAIAAAGIVVLTGMVHAMFETRWLSAQWQAAVAANQFWVYGSRYLAPGWLVVAALVALVGVWVRGKGVRAALEDVPLQIGALTAIGIVALPDVIQIPRYSHVLAYLGQRMSLALGVWLCAMAARTRVPAYARYGMAATALVFFAFLWRDDGVLNGLEDQMESAVQQLPAGQRLVSAIMAADVNTIPTGHMIDRVCIERCYSYGNYEPSSRQFRVRVAGQSPVVVATDEEATGLQFGTYVVQARDVPLYQVVLGSGGRVAVRQLSVGQQSGIELWGGL